MSEEFECSQNGRNGFRELVPIKVNRIFDSCSDRDCMNNVAVILDMGELPSNINVVKCKCVKVSDICINIEPVPFNRGFYSIDITYTFKLEMLAYEKACDKPVFMTGTAYANKNCILYGSETNTKTFFSNGKKIGSTDCCCETVNYPDANVQVVEPIVLETRIGTVCCNDESGESRCQKKRTVIVTMGLFSVVELTRPVTLMVPSYEYSIPKKECRNERDTPCDIFDKIKFPTEEFSPSAIENDTGCGCGFDKS